MNEPTRQNLPVEGPVSSGSPLSASAEKCLQQVLSSPLDAFEIVPSTSSNAPTTSSPHPDSNDQLVQNVADAHVNSATLTTVNSEQNVTSVDITTNASTVEKKSQPVSTGIPSQADSIDNTPTIIHEVPAKSASDIPDHLPASTATASAKQVVADASPTSASPNSTPTSLPLTTLVPECSEDKPVARVDPSMSAVKVEKQQSDNPSQQPQLIVNPQTLQQQPEAEKTRMPPVETEVVTKVDPKVESKLQPQSADDKSSKLQSPGSTDDVSPLKRKATSPQPNAESRSPKKQKTEGTNGAVASESLIPRTSAPQQNHPQQQKLAATDNGEEDSRRPLPKGLPKTVRNRPDNSRVFIGNLASEYTDVHEILTVFHKYGELIEEPVLRRSFGFVQYSNAEAAKRAVDAEQGRMIGGIGIDLSIADNREVKKGTHVANNTPFSHSVPKATRPARRERDFSAPTVDRSRKRRRSLSPASAAKKGGVHPPQYRRPRPDPKNGIYLRILCMSPTAKAYARHCEATFRSMTGLHADVLNIVAAGLGEALGRAMRDVIPYVMVVASKDVEDGTCTIRTLEKTGYEKSGRGNGVIPLREAVEVCLIERGVIAPHNTPHQAMGMPLGAHPVQPTGMGRMAMGGANHVGGGRHLNGQHGLNGAGGSQWGGHNNNSHLNNPLQKAKPGWMTGPRTPHPANLRMASSSMGYSMDQPQPGMTPGMGPNVGYAYTPSIDGRNPYGHSSSVVPFQQSGAPPPRDEHDFGRGPPPPPQSNYGNGHAMGAAQNMGGGEYMRGPGGNISPSGGMQLHTGYMDRYDAHGTSGRGNQYGPRGSNRESEYDPAAVMPSQARGPEQQPYGSHAWGRDGGMNRNDVYGERTQPAVTRDRNGGFQTVGGGRQIYQGGSGSAGSYGYERNQTQNVDVPQQQYGGMNGGNYDTRQQNAYGAGGYGQQQVYAGGIQGGAIQQAHGVEGERYGSMYPQQAGQGQQQGQHGAVQPPRYGGNAGSYGGEVGRNGGWGTGAEAQGNGMGIHNGNMGGIQNDTMNGQMTGGMGHHGAYGMSDARVGANNEYAARGGGGGAMRGKETGRGSGGGGNAAGNLLGTATGTVDITKLTTLISAFQQKAAQQQQQQQQPQTQDPHPQPQHGANASRGGMGGRGGYGGGYLDHGQRMRGGHQQGYYR